VTPATNSESGNGTPMAVMCCCSRVRGASGVDGRRRSVHRDTYVTSKQNVKYFKKVRKLIKTHLGPETRLEPPYIRQDWCWALVFIVVPYMYLVKESFSTVLKKVRKDLAQDI
jgi:hypothetical protein